MLFWIFPLPFDHHRPVSTLSGQSKRRQPGFKIVKLHAEATERLSHLRHDRMEDTRTLGSSLKNKRTHFSGQRPSVTNIFVGIRSMSSTTVCSCRVVVDFLQVYIQLRNLRYFRHCTFLCCLTSASSQLLVESNFWSISPSWCIQRKAVRL